MEQVVGAGLLCRVWAPLLGLGQAVAGPVAIQQMPLLALGGACSMSGAPVSSILYPSGLRRAMLRAFPGEPGGVGAGLLSAIAPEKPMDVLEADLATFDELTRLRQAEVLACLNGLTEQQVLLRYLAGLDDDYLDDADGVHVLYEAARGLVRLGREPQRADALLTALVQQQVNSQVATMAAIQQSSLRLRQLDDLDGADRALAQARNCLDRLPAADTTQQNDELAWSRQCLRLLLESRFHRVLALANVRRRDGSAVRQAMEAAVEAADQLGRRTPPDQYLRLVILENEKILGESSVKAAGMQGWAEAVVAWSVRLLAVDPEDPFTWRVIAENASRCGLSRAANLAVAGLLALGGPGAVRTLQAVAAPVPEHVERTQTERRDAAATEHQLSEALHEQLIGFYHAG